MQTPPDTISSSLMTFPANWIFEPVCGKRPYRKGWTKSNVDRLHCLQELERGKATGIGLKLGEGLLAIDVDGRSASNLLEKFAGENGLQEFDRTVSWSSGKPGRQQYLFSVPEASWCRLRNLKILTGEIDADGKEEGLEFRWLGQQSVLPPSVHPDTQKPYFWVRSPQQVQTFQAPEWLIVLCENWRPEYRGKEEIELVRFPARLYQHFRRPLAIWLLARRFDISRWKHRGHPKGCGIGKFTLGSAAAILNRSKDHIRRMLCKAVKVGLLRDYSQKGDWITCYYTSFEKVCAIAGLEDIGPIAAVEIDSLSNLHILATEIEAQALQKQSIHQKRREEIGQGNAAKTPTRIIRPSDLLHPCEIPARVLAKGDRYIYCESEFAFYGGSQEGISRRRGISVSTVGRHLSNRYRLTASPVQQKHSGVPPIVKAQLAERLPLLKGMPSKLCREDGLFFAISDWFQPRCNVYLLNHILISCTRRRTKLSTDNDCLSNFESRRGDLKNKNLLSMLSEELECHCQQTSLSLKTKPER